MSLLVIMRDMRLIQAVMTTLALSFPMMGAEMSVKEYQQAISSADRDEVLMMHTYIRGLADGIDWTNVWSIRNGGRRLYCQPETLALNTNNYIRILDDEIDVVRGGESKVKIDDLPIGYVLLQGLVDTFPCPQK